jgi:DNA-binding NtrC family response regulator
MRGGQFLATLSPHITLRLHREGRHPIVGGPMSNQRPRVLVIDDEKHIRALLRELLERWGCQADLAANTTEGLRLFHEGGYDLVLTDLMMPGGNGLQLIQQVRDRDPAIGVIMLTGSVNDLAGPAAHLGFTVVRKPIALDGLQAAVRQALGGRLAPLTPG